jgi:3-dehydroquinate dehydratase/shikimate dehydrogenase
MSLVVSILAPDLPSLAALARSQLPFADILELRLDHIPNTTEDQLRTLIHSLPKPILCAINTPDTFGHFTGTPHTRLSTLRTAARAGAAYIDVDHRIASALGHLPTTCKRILSRHEPDRTPDAPARLLADLRSLALPGDLLKLVTHADRAEDGLRILSLLDDHTDDVIAFSTGDQGAFTRILAPILGSPLTYAAPARATDATHHGIATAPGQIPADILRSSWPSHGPSARTSIFAVVGNPARHSLSPHLHSALFRAHAIDAVYVALELETLTALPLATLDARFRGFSVTAPFKNEAFLAASWKDDASTRTSASNTLVREGAAWHAYNTDAFAVRATLEAACGSLVGLRAAIVGAGGAAMAALVALKEAGARVTLATRDPRRARELAALSNCDACSIAELATRDFELLVNCTPAGSLADPGAMPVAPSALHPGMIVLDAVYRPARTPLLAEAERRGARTIGGGEWFVRQALAQFRLFTGVEPDEHVARAAFERALAEVGP